MSDTRTDTARDPDPIDGVASDPDAVDDTEAADASDAGLAEPANRTLSDGDAGVVED